MKRGARHDMRRVAPADAPDDIQPLALRSMFWIPDHLSDSPWLEHLPFAFWLVEAQQPRVLVEVGDGGGASYFAFCQAVDRLGLDTRCFAVADADAGADPSGAEALASYNEARYSSFSRLVPGGTEALRQFTDGSIDLLHLDCRGGADEVELQLQRWSPKLSPSAVVLLHRASIPDPRRGVHRLVAELRTRHRVFEFPQGEGLALVAIGATQPDLLNRLLAAAADDRASKSLHEVFARLGKACADAHQASNYRRLASEMAERAAGHERELLAARDSLQQACHDLGRRNAELEEAQARIQRNAEAQAHERGQYSERISLLQEIRSEQRDEIARLQARSDAANQEVHARAAEMLRLAAENEERRIRMASAVASAERLESELAGLRASLAERDGRLASLAGELESARSRLAEMERQPRPASGQDPGLTVVQRIKAGVESAAVDEAKELRQEKQSLEAEIKRLVAAQQAARAKEVENAELRAALAAAEAGVVAAGQAAAEAAAEAQRVERDALEQRLAAANRRVEQAEADLAAERQALSGARDEATRELEQRKGELAKVQALATKLAERLETELAALREARAEAQRLAQAAEAERDAHQAALARASEQLEQVRRENAGLVAGHEQALAAAAEEADRLREELQAVREQAEAAEDLHAEQVRSVRAELAQAESRIESGQLAHRQELERLAEAQAQLQADRDAVAKRLGEAVATMSASREMLLKLSSNVKSLASGKSRLEAELAAATEATHAAEQARARAAAAHEAAARDHAAALKAAQARQLASAADAQRLAAALDDARVEARKQAALHARTEASLRERFQEIARLGKLLIERDQLLAQAQALGDQARQAAAAADIRSGELAAELEAANARLDAMGNSRAWRVTAPVRALARVFRGRGGAGTDDGADAVAADAAELRDSDLFDADWYLASYPDVAQAGLDPAGHYLGFGAGEGRDPGPGFSTKTYLERNPDVLQAGINPLLHYLRYGKQEGRLPR